MLRSTDPDERKCDFIYTTRLVISSWCIKLKDRWSMYDSTTRSHLQMIGYNFSLGEHSKPYFGSSFVEWMHICGYNRPGDH